MHKEEAFRKHVKLRLEQSRLFLLAGLLSSTSACPGTCPSVHISRSLPVLSSLSSPLYSFHWVAIINCWIYSLVSSPLDSPADPKGLHIPFCTSKGTYMTNLPLFIYPCHIYERASLNHHPSQTTDPPKRRCCCINIFCKGTIGYNHRLTKCTPFLTICP